MGKRLLVADDSLTIQKVIKLALSNEGYEIQAVSDGNMALRVIPEFKPHAVLIDISLPGQSSFEVKSAINQIEELNNISFILMSSAYEAFDEDQAKAVGFDGRLTKPFDPSQLRDVLHAVLSAQDLKTPGQSDTHQKRPSPPLAPKASSPSIPAFDLQLPPLPLPPKTSPRGLAAPSVPLPPPPPPGITSPFLSSHESNDHLSFDPPAKVWTGTDEGDEIKKLTESTIKMSGLDDFNWSVQETAMKDKLPPPAPPPSQLRSFSQLENYESEITGYTLETPSKFEDDGSTNFKIEYNSGVEVDFTLPSQALAPPVPSITFGGPVKSNESVHIPLPPISDPLTFDSSIPPRNQSHTMNPTDVESVIRSQLETQLREMAQKLLPEIAERIIREEIHKMLESQI